MADDASHAPTNGETTPEEAGEMKPEVKIELTVEPIDYDADASDAAFENNGVDAEGELESEAEIKPEKIDSETEEPILSLDQLIMENTRLQGVFHNLVNRQTILEEFIEVEHGDAFDSFLQKRERLVNVMGLDGKTETGTDGIRSVKSKELVNLLKVVRERAEYCNEGQSSSSSNANTPGTSRQQQSQQQKRPATSGGGGQHNDGPGPKKKKTRRGKKKSENRQEKLNYWL